MTLSISSSTILDLKPGQIIKVEKTGIHDNNNKGCIKKDPLQTETTYFRLLDKPKAVSGSDANGKLAVEKINSSTLPFRINDGDKSETKLADQLLGGKLSIIG